MPSKTQPNDVLSVREIIERSSRGLPLNAGDIGYYDDPDDVDTSDYDTFDPFEKAQHLRDRRAEIEEAQASLNRSATKEQEAAEGAKPQKSEGQSDNSLDSDKQES